jgi:hypothetical protein
MLKKLKDLNRINDVRIDFNKLTRDILIKPDINNYLAYVTLKELFAQPLVVKDNKSQWCWNFKFNDFIIEIYDWNIDTISIAIYRIETDIKASKILANQIIQQFEKEINKRKHLLKSAIKKSTYRVIENPFYTYYSTGSGLLELAKDARNGEYDLDDNIMQEFKLAFKHLKKHSPQNNICKATFLMFLSSIEGLINILYELYLKKELRVKRIIERIGRDNIDIKIRMLPVYCNGFKKEFNFHDDSRFKEYFKLVNIRNDFVHANIVDSLKSFMLLEDSFTFILDMPPTAPTQKAGIRLRMNLEK